jgi:hypothetical protein
VAPGTHRQAVDGELEVLLGKQVAVDVTEGVAELLRVPGELVV